MDKTILVIGEALVDRVTRDGIALGAVPGGSPLNVAVGLARLGHDVHFATQFGSDSNGTLIAEYLDRELVTYSNEGLGSTSQATARIDVDGAAQYDFEITWDIDLNTAATRKAVESAGVIHTGSLGAHYPPGGQQVYRQIVKHAPSAILSYDPNCRPSVLSDRTAVRSQVEDFIAISDIVKASQEDLEWLYPGRGLRDTIAAWIDKGVGLLMVTRGGNGALAARRGFDIIESGPLATRVADTIGAGDSFMAALLGGLVGEGICGPDGRHNLVALRTEALFDVMHVANVAASITCSRTGANPPSSLEVRAEMARVHHSG